MDFRAYTEKRFIDNTKERLITYKALLNSRCVFATNNSQTEDKKSVLFPDFK